MTATSTARLGGVRVSEPHPKRSSTFPMRRFGHADSLRKSDIDGSRPPRARRDEPRSCVGTQFASECHHARRHRPRPACRSLRPLRRRGPIKPVGPRRRVIRIPRPQRSRQDHDHPRADRRPRSVQRTSRSRGTANAAAVRPHQAALRLRPRHREPHRRIHRPRESRTLRPAVRHPAVRGQPRAGETGTLRGRRPPRASLFKRDASQAADRARFCIGRASCTSTSQPQTSTPIRPTWSAACCASWSPTAQPSSSRRTTCRRSNKSATAWRSSAAAG